MGNSHVSGPIIETSLRNSQDTARAQVVRDCTTFIPPTHGIYTVDTAVLTEVRNAAGDYSWNRAAASGAETDTIVLPINLGVLAVADTADATIGEVARGARINTIDCVYRIGVVGATSITPLLKSTIYTDAAAIAITDRPVTPTPFAAGDITFHATNMQRTTITVTTPFVVTSAMNVALDLTLVFANTGTFQYHGMYVNFDLLL